MDTPNTQIDSETIPGTEANTEIQAHSETNEEIEKDIISKQPLPLSMSVGVVYDAEGYEDVLGSGSVMKLVIKEGEPHTNPHKEDFCIINYSIFLEKGTLVEKKENFEFILGDAEIIQGLDVTIGFMNLKEICNMKIIPRLAFGSKGLPPLVSSKDTVIIQVELLSHEALQELDLMTIFERKSHGNRKRARGNWWYGRGDYLLAVQNYRTALQYFEEGEFDSSFSSTESTYRTFETQEKKQEVITDLELQALLEDRMNVYNNLAAAELKLESYKAALIALKTVLNCQPNNVKAWFRKAKALQGLNKYKEALECLKVAGRLAPEDTEIRTEVINVNQQMKKETEVEKQFYKRMLNTKKDLPKSFKKYNYKMLKMGATFGVTCLIALISVVAYRGVKFN